MNITRITRFQSAMGKSEKLYFFLRSLMPYMTSSQGCISCEILRDKDNKESFVVIEKWESAECHMKSVEGCPNDKMNETMSLVGASPQGDYYNQ